MKEKIEPLMVAKLIQSRVHYLHIFLIYFLFLFGLFPTSCVMCSDVYLHDMKIAQRMYDTNPNFFFLFSFFQPTQITSPIKSLQDIFVSIEKTIRM